MRINKVCPHCGNWNQMELQFDHTWQLECLQCSHILSIPKSEVPLIALQNPRQYQIAEIPSPTDVITVFPIPFGHYRPSIRRDSTEE